MEPNSLQQLSSAAIFKEIIKFKPECRLKETVRAFPCLWSVMKRCMRNQVFKMDVYALEESYVLKFTEEKCAYIPGYKVLQQDVLFVDAEYIMKLLVETERDVVTEFKRMVNDNSVVLRMDCCDAYYYNRIKLIPQSSVCNNRNCKEFVHNYFKRHVLTRSTSGWIERISAANENVLLQMYRCGGFYFDE